MQSPIFTSPLLSDLPFNPASSLRSESWRRTSLSQTLAHPLDRVQVLGEPGHPGHTGCVNALSWTSDGETLLSGGDDQTVRFWRLNSSDLGRDFPLECTAVLFTGHTANIFNAHMLPHSSRVATVAGDSEVRIFDVGEGMSTSVRNGENIYPTSTSLDRVLRCHSDRVKRIVTEESPDMFLTVAEDGSVRQHDLRTSHVCTEDGGSCPGPLIKMDHELTTLSLSPLTPYQFVVAGDSPYGYLYDRRQLGRYLHEEWGQGFQPHEENLATCVRRFGKLDEHKRRGREHVTGARVSPYNGHEVLLSYSGDACYLFSTNDDITEFKPSSPIRRSKSPRPQRRKTSARPPPSYQEINIEGPEEPEPDIFDEHGLIDTIQLLSSANGGTNDENEMDDDEDEDEDEDEELVNTDLPAYHPNVPYIMPRMRFEGACNVETVKDVNFLGPSDEWVVSGSDDGLWFMWNKHDGKLHGLYEGDGSVVNVIEGHPYLPLVAVSGIDTTVKLFAPTRTQATPLGVQTSQFSRLQNADEIIEENKRRNRETRHPSSAMLLRRLFRLAELQSAAEGRQGIRCTHQ